MEFSRPVFQKLSFGPKRKDLFGKQVYEVKHGAFSFCDVVEWSDKAVRQEAASAVPYKYVPLIKQEKVLPSAKEEAEPFR